MMKLIYTPTDQHTFILEGTIEEIHNFVNLITRGHHQIIPSAQLDTQIIEPRPTKKTRNDSTAPLFTDNFLKSVYLYDPNPGNDSGRGAFIAQQILKGETLNIDKLAKRAHGSRQTVLNVANRLRDHNAVIELTSTTVKLLSIPAPPYQMRTYNASKTRRPSVTKTSAVTNTVASSSSVPERLATTLSAIKLS